MPSPAVQPLGEPDMKKNASTVFLIFIFLVGLSLLLYPSFADYWNSFTQTRAIAAYTEQVAAIDTDAYDQLWQDARSYNQSLLLRTNQYILTEEQIAQYNSLLNLTSGGIMGYIQIPAVGINLPIYHGTDEAILQVAVGHLEWTSLPVGGESTHCVLSGHRGLPSAKLFTDIDQLVVGDTFLLQILDDTLTYEVDQILIVLPNEVEALEIVEGKDYCTLVTCTPYGVNSHRLLVRGHRVETQEAARTVRVTADAVQIEPLIIAPIVAVPILLVLLILLLVTTRRKR